MSEEILFSRDGPAGRILLNRPKVLNALSHHMIIALHEQLKSWADDTLIKFILIEGVGEKAFCAGGDIRALYESGPNNEEFVTRFFSDEYRLNMAIKAYPKPYIAIMDGVVMGGGVGVSVPGLRRIVTERTRCAMPETGIGMFPDVGGTYFLSRAPDHVGVYLGLTGEQMNAANTIYTGFADRLVYSDKLPDLLAEMCRRDYEGDTLAQIDNLLKSYEVEPVSADLRFMSSLISDIFSKGSVEEITCGLEEQDSDWSNRTLAILKQKSPTSLKVTLKAINLARGLTFDECMAQEYRIVLQIMKGRDFYEGTRALIIEKDGQPNWKPAQLGYITDEIVEAHFQHSGELEL